MSNKYNESNETQITTSSISLSMAERYLIAEYHENKYREAVATGVEDGHDAKHHAFCVSVMQRGFTAEYPRVFVCMEPEMSASDSALVNDFMQMFRVLKVDIDHGENTKAGLDSDLRRRLSFQGFDRNDPQESKMLDYLILLIDQNRWIEQKEVVDGREKGNSHTPKLDEYLKMLDVYREVLKERAAQAGSPDSRPLTVEELKRISGV